jgi:hypothetical protein
MQIVRIQALAREGFSHRPRAGRFFPAGEPVTVEVVDQDDDPTIDVEKIDSAGKKFTAKEPDPKRMSRKVFESMIMTDPVLRVLADGETVSALSQAALDAARKQASDLAGELTDTKARLAEAQEKLAAANARIAALEGTAKVGGGASGKPALEVDPEHSEKISTGGKGGKGGGK